MFSYPFPLMAMSSITPNRHHNSGKPRKRKLNPRALKSCKQSLQHLKRKLGLMK